MRGSRRTSVTFAPSEPQHGALVQRILDVAQRRREPDVYHHLPVMICGLLWKYLKRLRFVMAGGYEAAPPVSTEFVQT